MRFLRQFNRRRHLLFTTVLLIGFIFFMGEFIAFKSQPRPEAFKYVEGEKLAISSGQTVLEGTEQADGDCSYGSNVLQVGATLPDSIKFSSISFRPGDQPCSIVVDEIAFDTELPTDYQRVLEPPEGGQEEPPVPPGSSGDSQSEPGNALSHLIPFVPESAYASNSKYVESRLKWVVDRPNFPRAKLVWVGTILTYYDIDSTITPRSSKTQYCQHVFWWDEVGCEKSQYLSPDEDYFEMTTAGDFELQYVPEEYLPWYEGEYTEPSDYDISSDAIGFAQPGSWGHSCIFDPFTLPKLDNECEGFHGNFP